MPELPDIAMYLERLDAFTGGQTLVACRIVNPFVMRTVSPSPADLAGRRVTGTRRVG